MKLEKLGIYDLIVLLLTGMIISALTLIVLQYVFEIEYVDGFYKTSGTVLFLAISYFIGMVFQEIGSIVQKHIIRKNNGVLKRALDTSYNSHYLLTETEKNKIITWVTEELKLDAAQDNNAIIYNYCKLNLMKNGDMSKAIGISI